MCCLLYRYNLTHWLLELFAKSAFFGHFKWWFISWISAKLPLIWSKKHLQHNSLPFLPPASRFSALWLGQTQKSKFWDSFWRRKWPTSLGLSIFGIFFHLSFFSFSLFAAVIDFPLGMLAVKKTSEKASSRQAIFSMEQPGVVAGNFALSFSLNFLSIFVHM